MCRDLALRAAAAFSVFSLLNQRAARVMADISDNGGWMSVEAALATWSDPIREADSALDEIDRGPLSNFKGTWWLVYTKPRNEKALAADLGKMGIPCFLPLARVRKCYSGRYVEVRLPLFPSYVFLNGGDEERLASLKTNRVISVLSVADQRRLERDLRNVYLACSSKQPVDLYPGLRAGRRCRVVAGALQGLEGVVLRRRNLCRVYVGVEVLGQSAQLEIDPSLLEIAE